LCPPTRRCRPPDSVAVALLLTLVQMCFPWVPQAILCAILLNHRPHLLQKFMDNTRLPGESNEAAVVRWRQVAVGSKASSVMTWLHRLLCWPTAARRGPGHALLPEAGEALCAAAKASGTGFPPCRSTWAWTHSRRVICWPYIAHTVTACASWQWTRQLR
jgi:hypothetical protein